MAKKNNEKRTKAFSSEMVPPIKRADDISRIIIDERPDILNAIISRRIRYKTYDTIAVEEAVSLASLGAITQAVRKAIVARVCSATLAESFNKKIIKKILSRRPRPLLTPARQRALKIGQRSSLLDWTDEMDEELLGLANTVRRVSAPREGAIDWLKIAEIMEQKYSYKLKPCQWRSHTQYIRSKSNNQ